MTLRFATPEELARTLGERIRQLRISRRIDQAELAAKAQISTRAIGALENGRGSTVDTLLRVLKGLGLADRIDALVPPSPVSPLAILRQGAPPQRVRKPKKKGTP